MELRVEYYYDEEAGNWGFRVPALAIVGGGDDTRAEAEEHAREAILFTLADDTRDHDEPGRHVGYVRVSLDPIPAAQPVAGL